MTEYYRDLPELNSSILDSIKVQVGIPALHREWDQMIQLDINTAFSILHQIGVGPKEPYKIESEYDTWDDFVCQVNMEMVKSFIAHKVRELYDPPTGTQAGEALKRQLDEEIWRLSVAVEEDHRVNGTDWEENQNDDD